MNQIVNIDDVVFEVREVFDRVRVTNTMNFEREAEFALQLLYKSDFSLKVARANPQSVREAVTNVAAIGLTLNPALRLSYLVPRDGVICLDVGYLGLVQLALDGGSIRWARCELVHETDGFEYQGPAAMPVHKFNPFGKNRGPVVGVYSVAKTSDGDILADVMDIEEVHRIRDRSQSWKSGKNSPWKTDEGEMTRKTLIKRASKLWPKCDRVAIAADYLNRVNGEGYSADITAAVTPASGAPQDYSQDRFDSLAKKLRACKTIGDLEREWGSPDMTKADRRALSGVKDEVKDRLIAEDIETIERPEMAKEQQ